MLLDEVTKGIIRLYRREDIEHTAVVLLLLFSYILLLFMFVWEKNWKEFLFNTYAHCTYYIDGKKKVFVFL